MISDMAWFFEALATRNSQDAIGPAEPDDKAFAAKPERQATPAEALDVVRFWQDAGPALWFAKDPEFDRRFRERFLALHEAAACGDLRRLDRLAIWRAGLAAAARPVSAQRLSRHAAHVRHRRHGTHDGDGRHSRRP